MNKTNKPETTLQFIKVSYEHPAYNNNELNWDN